MKYYDWLIITNAIILLGFLTLFGLALLETSFRDTNKWVLWFSISGVIIFILLTGVLIWYYHGKDKIEKKNIKTNLNNTNVQQEEKRDVPEKYKDQILVNNLKSDINKDKQIR